MQTTDADGVALSADTLDAIASADSVWAERATFAWPGGLYADATPMIVSAETDATLISGVPDKARRPVGFQSRTLKLVLAGMVDGTDEDFDAFALLNPLNSGSPFYRMDLRGTKVTYDVGPYTRGSAVPSWIRQFTGQVDDITINDDGTVTLDCLDRMTELRPVVSMPAAVTAPPYNAGLTPEFGHDALLRNATSGAISSWPAIRPQCVLAAGMRSSVWPEVGSLNTTADIPAPTFTTGHSGTGLVSAFDDSGLGSIGYALAGPVGTHLYVEWTYRPAPNSGGSLAVGDIPHPEATLGEHVAVTAYHASVTIDFLDAASNLLDTFTWTPGDMKNFIGCALTLPAVGGTTWSATLQCGDGTTTTTGSRTLSSPRTVGAWGDAALTGFINIFDLTTPSNFEGVQVTTETAPVSNYGFTPQAVLDPSLTTLQVTPAVSGDPLAAFQDICAADLTTAGFDEKGIYRSTNRDNRRGGTAVGTYRSDSTLDSAELQLTGAGYANRVQAPVATWKFAAPADVWASESVRTIPAHCTGYSFTVRVDPADGILVAAVDGTLSLLPDGGGNNGSSYYRASIDAAGTDVHSGLKNGRVTQIDSTHFRVTFDNVWQRKAYLTTPVGYGDLAPGTPTLRIGGIAVTPADAIIADSQWPPAAEGGAKTTPVRGEVPYPFPDNPWRQDIDGAQALTDDTLCELRRPLLDITNVAISRPDPTLQLGDRIHLYAPHLYLDDDVTVFGIHNGSAFGQATQTLDVRMVAAPGMFILGLPGRCELGMNTYV